MALGKKCFLCLTDSAEEKCDNCETHFCCQDHGKAHRHSSSGYCYPFEIAQSSEFGRYMVATRDIQPLEVILIDEVAALGPATKTKPICLECLKGLEDLEPRCKGCQFPLCAQCLQAPTKRFHNEVECEILSRIDDRHLQGMSLSEDSILFALVFLVRVLLLRDGDRLTYKRLDYLMDGNTSDLMNEDSFSLDIAKIMKDELKMQTSHEEIVRLMGIKRTNASTLLSVGLPHANALHPIYNLMNSFCTCNTRCTIDEKTFQIVVRAQTSIKKGQQLTTRYYPPWQGQPIRLAEIFKHWQFICCCDRCKDPTEFGTNYSAIKCKKCQDGYLLPLQSNKMASPWCCGSCQAKLSYSEISTIVSDIESKIKEWTAKQPIENWSEILDKLGEKLHPNHFLGLQLKKKITSQWQASNIQQLEEKLDYCQQVFDIACKLDPGLTLQKGSILRTMAMTRSELAKALKRQGDKDVGKRCAELGKQAIEEMRMVAACIKIPPAFMLK